MPIPKWPEQSLTAKIHAFKIIHQTVVGSRQLGSQNLARNLYDPLTKRARQKVPLATSFWHTT